MSVKTILVTGGYGLVGNAINELSKSYQYNFIFLNSKMCDLCNYQETKKMFNALNPHYVIHLAACVGGLYKNMKCGVEMLNNNILINTNVLRCSHEHNVEKLIACLSTCIFPDNISSLIDETMLHLGPPHDSNEGYAYAKRLLEVQCRNYNKQYNCNFMCIVPTNIYGKHDNYNLEDSHVIPGMIHRCFLAKNENSPWIVRGTGKPLRQFIYSTDLATIIMELLFSKSIETVIIANEIEYSIKDIAELISLKMKYPFEFDSSYSDGQFRKTVDNSKLKSIIDFDFTKIDLGLSETIDYFIKNYNIIRK